MLLSLLLVASTFSASFKEYSFTEFRFSPDETYIVGASVVPDSEEGGSIKVWNMSTGDLVYEASERVVRVTFAPDRPLLHVVTAKKGYYLLKDGPEYTVDLITGSITPTSLGFFGFKPVDGVFESGGCEEYMGKPCPDDDFPLRFREDPYWLIQSPATGEFWGGSNKWIHKRTSPWDPWENVLKQRSPGRAAMGSDGRLLVLDDAGWVLNLETSEKTRLPKDRTIYDAVFPGSSSILVMPYEGDKARILRASDMELMREIPLDPPITGARGVDRPGFGDETDPCAWFEPSELLVYNDRLKGIRLVDTLTGQTVGYLDTGLDFHALWVARQAQQEAEDLEWQAKQDARLAVSEAFRLRAPNRTRNRPMHGRDRGVSMVGVYHPPRGYADGRVLGRKLDIHTFSW